MPPTDPNQPPASPDTLSLASPDATQSATPDQEIQKCAVLSNIAQNPDGTESGPGTKDDFLSPATFGCNKYAAKDQTNDSMCGTCSNWQPRAGDQLSDLANMTAEQPSRVFPQ
jgi:hypothetical protein